jgi:eukaryotic translation initiation factor 2C
MNVGSRDMPSYVPVDVCEVIAGQPAKMKLSANQTAQMIRFAVRSPGENADSIVQQGAPLLGFSPTTNNVLVSRPILKSRLVIVSLLLVVHNLMLFEI